MLKIYTLMLVETVIKPPPKLSVFRLCRYIRNAFENCK